MDNSNGCGSENAVQKNMSPIALQRKRKYCKYCGKELCFDAVFCSSCGRQQGNVPAQQTAGQMMQQPVDRTTYIQSAYQAPQPVAVSNVIDDTTTVIVEESSSNGIGVAGFVIALLGLIFFWLPLVNFLLWLLGLVFSVVGVFKVPRGMAIAGLVVSFIGILLILYMMGSIAAAFS